MDTYANHEGAIAMPANRELNGEYRIAFGLRVRTFRKEMGLSQDDLASRSGLHRNYISDVERGRRNLSLDALLRLANGLSINIRELF